LEEKLVGRHQPIDALVVDGSLALPAALAIKQRRGPPVPVAWPTSDDGLHRVEHRRGILGLAWGPGLSRRRAHEVTARDLERARDGAHSKASIFASTAGESSFFSRAMRMAA